MASINPLIKKVCEMSGKKKESQKYNTAEDIKCLAKIIKTDAEMWNMFYNYVSAMKVSKKKKEA